MAAIALFVSVWNLNLTHLTTQVRDHENGFRDTGLDLVARLYERISLFLREEGYLNTVLSPRIRDTEELDDEDLRTFYMLRTEVDDLIREIDMVATQLHILATTELAGVAEDVRSISASRSRA
ncbi:hypothetical protein [Antrihabitans stalactiti]|uniref:Uncharacterized protein n=1 Tax=Antrihabitans stalactiti TaxID=2584121 RepID=A0A848KIE4_9NOCA|nr:hypothetical protein [Antrihabitans stalactiti]NMN97556.1 hypothetical protein [Antrihabitans stalactiti]